MSLKKEFKDRSDNLKKRESNLTKDTKDTQTTSDKALQHSQSKLGDKTTSLQSTQTQQLSGAKSNVIGEEKVSTQSKLISEFSSSENNTQNQNIYHSQSTNNIRNNLQQNSTFNQSNSKLQLEQSQSKLISANDSVATSNKLQPNNTLNSSTSTSNSKLQLEQSQSKLVSANDSVATSSKLQPNSTLNSSTSTSNSKLQLEQSQSKLVSANDSVATSSKLQPNSTLNSSTSTSNSKLQLEQSQSKLVSANDSVAISSKLQPNSTINPSNSKNNNSKLQLEQAQSKLVSANDSVATSSKLQPNSTINPSNSKNNNSKLQLEQAQSKLVSANDSVATSSKLQPNSTINPSNSKLQLQQSAKKLVSANNSNYSTDGNNAKKLQLQKSQNKLLNADEQTQNKASKLKDVSSNITKQSLKTSGKAVKKGVEKYKQELQREDQAVQVTTNTADSAILVTKKAKTALKNRKLKKATKEELQLQKAKTVLQKTISEDNLTIKKSKEKIKQNKLKKDTKQIDQAKKELKIKNEKLKEKKADLKLVKKEQSKDNFIKKATKPPVSLTTTAIKRGASNYKKQLENGNEGTEVVGKSVSLVKEGTKALSKAKEIRKHKLNQEKLKGISTKLAEGNKKIAIKKSQLNKLKKTDKVQLKKKMIKRKMYASNSEKKKTLSAFSGGIKNLFKNLKDIKGKVSFVALKNLIGQKFAIGAGAVFIKLIPLLLIFLLLFGVIAFFMAGSGGYEEEIKADIGNSIGLSPEVEQWRDLVTREAEAQGMGDYVALILAIIQVESGGKGTRDIMQSSESAGHPPNYFQTEEESVRQGIKYLKGIVMILKAFNAGFENNSKLIAQAYNFGANFANYVGIQGGEYSIDVAETYSRDVVAPSLGNTTGEKYSYVNEVSKSLGKTYLYRNGGNFMYGDLVAQYLSGANGITGDFAIVVAELEKYIGWEYVWGGKSPSTGFDCSGFVSWGLKQIGINLPSYALSQYEQTKPIDPKDAQPGDLIFFKGTYGGANHISHVGFYIDEKTMLDSNGSGVGYHNWKTNYWQKHFAGIRRVVK